jgi:hypothetical protein
MVPGRLTLAVEKCIAKQKALVSRKKRRRLQEAGFYRKRIII